MNVTFEYSRLQSDASPLHVVAARAAEAKRGIRRARLMMKCIMKRLRSSFKMLSLEEEGPFMIDAERPNVSEKMMTIVTKASLYESTVNRAQCDALQYSGPE